MRPLFTTLAASLAPLACALPSIADDRPNNLRVCVQFIEVPHPVLTDLLGAKDAAGPALHQQAMAVVKDGKAKLLESCVVMTRSGQRATIESVGERMYPMEYDPSHQEFGFGWPPAPVQPQPSRPHERVRPFPGNGFGTHNAGVTFEIEPTLGADDQLIDLWFEPEVDTQVRLETLLEHIDEWGDASLRNPIFETWHLKTCVTLMAGQFEMVSVVTPKPNEPVPATLRKILVFVRADVVRVED